MKFILTKKDIISLNEQFEERSSLNNEQSLDFALSYAKKTENWIKALAYLVRAITLDHVFHEGNKRTGALLIAAYAEYEGHSIYKDKVVKLIRNIIIKRITSIKRIEEMINDAIR